MTDDRVNIKVPPEVHAELDADRDMSWPDYLLHLKRTAERDAVQSGGVYATVSGFDADGEHNLRAVLKDVLEELLR